MVNVFFWFYLGLVCNYHSSHNSVCCNYFFAILCNWHPVLAYQIEQYPRPNEMLQILSKKQFVIGSL